MLLTLTNIYTGKMILTLGAHPICDPVNWPHMCVCVLAYAPTCAKCVTSWQVFTFLIGVTQANKQKQEIQSLHKKGEKVKERVRLNVAKKERGKAQRRPRPVRGFTYLNLLSTARFIRIWNHPSALYFLCTWRSETTCTCWKGMSEWVTAFIPAGVF